MCGGSPKVPDPLPQRQGQRAPDAGMVANRSGDRERRRMGYAATILPQLAAPAATTGKSLLGS